MHILGSMSITADRKTVLETITRNLGTHKTIVAEARAGYIAKAKAALTSRMKDLENSKVVPLSFLLMVPQDHTRVYETAIQMLSLHTQDTIVLDSTQVRNLVMDDWDWKAGFIHTNSAYSGTAAASLGNDGPLTRFQ